MRSRVENIIRTRLVHDDASRIKGLLTTLNEAANWLVEDKNDLEEVEQELMLQTGEFLFLEEEVHAPEKAQPKDGRLAPSKAEKKSSTPKEASPEIMLEKLSSQVEESNNKLEESWKLLVRSLPVDGSRPLTEEEATQGKEIRAYLKELESQSQQALLQLGEIRSSGKDYDAAELRRTEMLYHNQTIWRGDFRRKLRRLNLINENTVGSAHLEV